MTSEVDADSDVFDALYRRSSLVDRLLVDDLMVEIQGRLHECSPSA